MLGCLAQLTDLGKSLTVGHRLIPRQCRHLIAKLAHLTQQQLLPSNRLCPRRTCNPVPSKRSHFIPKLVHLSHQCLLAGNLPWLRRQYLLTIRAVLDSLCRQVSCQLLQLRTELIDHVTDRPTRQLANIRFCRRLPLLERAHLPGHSLQLLGDSELFQPVGLVPATHSLQLLGAMLGDSKPGGLTPIPRQCRHLIAKLAHLTQQQLLPSNRLCPRRTCNPVPSKRSHFIPKLVHLSHQCLLAGNLPWLRRQYLLTIRAVLDSLCRQVSCQLLQLRTELIDHVTDRPTRQLANIRFCRRLPLLERAHLPGHSLQLLGDSELFQPVGLTADAAGFSPHLLHETDPCSHPRRRILQRLGLRPQAVYPAIQAAIRELDVMFMQRKLGRSHHANRAVTIA